MELFSVEFMLNEFLPRGRGVGSWIMQQMVLWTRSLPPETLVRQIHISSVDAKNIHNLIRRSRLWRGLGFRFPPGNQLNAAAGRRTAVATGQVFNAPGGALVSAVRRLEDCYRGLQEKIVQLEGKKRSQKQLITSLRNRPFYHLLHRKGASSRTRNVTPCHCGQKNCLCRRAGILTWRWRNGQPGLSGWQPCVVSRRKKSLSSKGILPRKVNTSLTCRQSSFLSCGESR